MLCREIKQVEAQVSAGALDLREAVYRLKTVQELAAVLGETVELPLLPGLSVIYPEDPYYGLDVRDDEADQGYA